IHQHPMRAYASPGTARDPVEHAREAGDTHRDAALLLHLAARGVHRRLAEIHETAGQAPASFPGRFAAADEENAAAREDDGADAHPRIVGVLAAHRLLWGAPIWPPSLLQRRAPRPPRTPP